jgi:predicted regulator of Ras-like GTPase activity (Roadblock/LC7/MglB family)
MINTRNQIKEIADELKANEAVGGVAIIRTDGALLASNFPKYTLSQEIFAMMGATLLGAAKNITLKSDMGLPQRIIIETSEGNVIISGIGNKALLVCLVGDDHDPSSLSDTMDSAIDRVLKLL